MRVVFIILPLIFSAGAAMADCDRALPDSKLKDLFRFLGAKQIELEFGSVAQFSDLALEPVGRDLVRITAQAEYNQPGSANANERTMQGWITRCEGTLILRGYTWLADGKLQAPHYSLAQMPGRGVRIGAPDANKRFIAFVDSRCPHCHRLVTYARELAKAGKIQLELRQVAYLETPEQAAADTQLWLTGLAMNTAAHAVLPEADYLDMLGGFGNAEEAAPQHPVWKQALELIKQNTKTARDVLKVNQVPALLIYDLPHAPAYRLTGYWEMNRHMQPDI